MAAPDSALERLLAVEARLDRMLADEAVQAEALVRAATAEAAALEARLDQELAAATAQLDSRLTAERDARLAFAEEEAHRRLARYQSAGPFEVGELAAWVRDQVLAAVERPA